MEQNFFEKPFVFMNKEYKDGPQLVKALIENWDIAVSVLRRGDLKGFEVQADKIWEGKEEESCAFQKALHQLDPSLPGIPFMDKEKKKAEVISFEQVGKILSSTQKGDPYYDTFKRAAKSGVFSAYMPQLRELENLLIQDGDQQKREEAGKKFDLKLQGKKYLRYQGVTYTSDWEFAKKVKEVLEAGYEETFQFLEDLYESDECRDNFQIWGQETDAARKNQDFELLHQKWTELRSYMEDRKGKDWKNRIWMGNIMSDTPDLKSIWAHIYCFRSPSEVERFLVDVKSGYRCKAGQISMHLEQYHFIRAMLNEMGRTLLDEGKKKTESIKKYKIWKDTAEVISAGNESIALFKDAAAQVEKVLGYYRQNRLIEGLKTTDKMGKRYLMDVILFPTAEFSFVTIDTLLNEVKRNEEDAGMAFLRLSLATRCVMDEKELIREKDYRIEGEFVDDYYLKKTELFSGEMAATLIRLGKKERVDSYRKEWKSLAETLGKTVAPSCRSKLDTFINDWEQRYQQVAGNGKKLPSYTASNRLYQKARLKNIIDEYRECKQECEELENTFGEVIRTYKEKLEKKYQAVECCGNAEYGKLLEGSKKACEEFYLEVDEAENAVSLAARKSDAAYDKAKKLLEELKKREASEEEKEKKASARKRFIKKHRAKALVALVLIGFGVFFYNRYMTSTYYGTAFYLGKMFDYEEYTIAEGATKIASNAFKGMENLKTIDIPDTVEQIGKGAFTDCVSLEKVELPDGVSSVGEGAFRNCISLKEFRFGKGMQSAENYGKDIFENCVRLEKMELPGNIQGKLPASMLRNCSSLDIGVDESQLYSDNVYNVLYVNGVEGVALLENEVQLKNVLRGKEFTYDVADIIRTISYEEGQLLNISFGEEMESESGRRITYSCDYQTAVCVFHLSGVLEQENYEKDAVVPLNVSVSCDSLEILIDQIMVQGEDGNYPMLQKVLDGKNVYIEEQESNLELKEEQIFINEASVSQTFDDEQNCNIYTIVFDAELHRKMGNYKLSGELKLSEKSSLDGDVTFEVAEFLGSNLLGTYDSFSISKQYGNYYSALVDGKGCIIMYDGNIRGEGTWLEVTNSDPRHSFKIDWENDCLLVSGNVYKKQSNDVEAMPQEYEELIGVWEGQTTYLIPRMDDRYRTVSATKYILPYDTGVRAIFVYGTDPCIAFEKITYDAESKNIIFERRLDLSDQTFFADIKGNLNESCTVLSGEVHGHPFKFVKQETEE